MTDVDLGKHLTFRGTSPGKTVDLINATEDATLERSLSEASTLTITARDGSKALWRSGLLDTGAWVDVDGARYELRQITRNGGALSLVFVDVIAARLQRIGGFLSATVGTYRGDFLRRLVRDAEIPYTIYQGRELGPSKTALTRASADDPGGESTWTATGRIADEVGWRRFSDGQQVIAGPDSWLLTRSTPVEVREGHGGVDQVDCDMSLDTKTTEATLTAWIDRDLLPGTPLNLVNEGPASGLWLVDTVTRPLTSRRGTVVLTRQTQQLTEARLGPGDTGSEPALGGQAGVTEAGGYKPGSAAVEAMLKWARAHLGNGYRYGSHGPDLWDCSAFVSAAIRAGGGGISGTAAGLLAACRSHGSMLPSAAAGAPIRGAILFDIGGGAGASGNHVALSLGNGQTIQAHSRADGVCILRDATDRQWTHAALVPGF